jgi:hypothetical protein
MLVAAVLVVAAVACGDSEDDDPQVQAVPLECDARIDRLDEVADGWPDPATLTELQTVNRDLFAAVNGLDDSCDPQVYERLDAIECDYLTTVTGADEAAVAFLASQQSKCEGDTGTEADPDEPTATIEDDDGSTAPTRDPCDEARDALVADGVVPTESDLPTGCPP